MIKFLMIPILIPIMVLIDIWFYFAGLYVFVSNYYDKHFKGLK